MTTPFPKSMTVLHVSQATSAGVKGIVLDLLRDQRVRGMNVALACPEEGELALECRALGVRCLVWNATRSPGLSVLSESRVLKGLIEQVKPDIVHLHSSKAGLAGRLALKGCRPTVFEPNGWSFHAVTGAVAAGSRWWERISAKWAHSTICVSDSEQVAGSQAGIRANWDVVKNGIDLRKWPTPQRDEQQAARIQLGLPSDAELVLCVGRLCRQKGQDLLLAAWPSIKERRSHTQLLLVGDGPDREMLKAIAPADVLFAGRRTDIRDWLLACDVVVMPSRWEGLSIALLESMACAQPVIAADVSGMQEAIGQDAGVLIPPEDPAALANAVTRLLADNEQRRIIGQNARTRVEQEFDLKNTCEKIVAIYSRLVETS